MSKQIKIFVSCHKECYVPKHEMFYPIQVGAVNAQKRLQNMLHDDQGNNISSKNPTYCELTGQYWVWKNECADYYGFFHYRRYMSFSKELLPHDNFQNAIIQNLDDDVIKTLCLDPDAMRKLIEQNDVIATVPVNLKVLNPDLKSNYDQYCAADIQYKKDLDSLIEIIEEKYPLIYPAAKEYFNATMGYFCNMFIMKKEIFNEYSQWLFDVLLEHEKRNDYHDYNIEAYRVSGYLGERLFGIYYTYLKQLPDFKYYEVQRTLFENTEIKKEIYPFFDKNNIAIALPSNEYYVPYMSIFLQSIIKHSNPEYNYDILILSQDISMDSLKILNTLVEGKTNFSIRQLNPRPVMEQCQFFVKGHFSVETYFRLSLPELLPHYNKILYLDSDMIALSDVAQIYNENIEEYLVAATRDADSAGLYNGYEPKKKNYIDNILKLKNPYDYFQGGTILFNLKKFREMFDTKETIQLAASKNWELLDQDVLNLLCQDKVKFIDMSWNVMVDFGNIRISQIIRLAPQWLNKMYMHSRKSPKIVHYAGPEKPWIFPEMDMAQYFWQFAKSSPYYEVFLYRMSYCISSNHSYRRSKKDSLRAVLYKIKYFVFPIGSRRHKIVKKFYKMIK